MPRVRLFISIGLLLSATLFAATERLYLKDGTYHMVREYKVETDRVRFYSTERGEWEELPLDLVDMKRTEKEIKDREDSIKAEAAQMDEEDKAIRAQRKEVSRIPMENGVFFARGDKIETLKAAEVKVLNNKRRSILKAVSPIPVIAGKSTVEIEGAQASFTVSGDRPEFYIRLANEEPFGLIRLKPAKSGRLVENLSIVPVTNDILEQRELIDTFKQQIGDGLFKIWPTKPITPGDYAVVEYTEGKVNIQVFDFTLK